MWIFGRHGADRARSVSYTHLSLGIPVLERAELLGALMEYYEHPIAVAGTHGKTTTTSMLSLVLMAANTDPTILVGGELPQIGGNFRLGKKNYLALEACEYVESFLPVSYTHLRKTVLLELKYRK